MKGTMLRRILLNAGYAEPIFKNHETQIALQNSRMVQTTSFIGSIMMLALTVSAFFVKSIGRVLPLYLITAVLFCATYCMVRFVRPKSSAAILVCNYAFLLEAFFFALGLDVIQKNPTATTVCVLLVALPLLIVDKPWREFLFFLAASVCFMLESVYLKQSPKASIDVVNAVAFLCIGTFLGYKHSQMMLRNIRGNQLLERQRDTDAMTGLYNKSAFETLARTGVEQNGGPAGMLVIDMDNFKFINDTYGHQAGDEILIKVGAMLSGLFRGEDYVCRFGGDEFVAFVPNLTDRAALGSIARRILDGVAQLRISADENYRAHLCIGLAAIPADATTYEELFKHADDALYRVKKNGKNGYSYYDAGALPHILVVDDIEMNRAILKKVLGTEYDIREAENGNEALKLLEADREIVLVITDIQMPGMDGIELIRHIRGQADNRDVAIIANTQYGDQKQEAQVIQLGADDFIYKAASPHVVRLRVRNVLKSKGQ